MTEKEFTSEAAETYLEQHRARQGVIESMEVLDGSLTASVAALTGLSRERIDELGGVGDWDE